MWSYTQTFGRPTLLKLCPPQRTNCMPTLLNAEHARALRAAFALDPPRAHPYRRTSAPPMHLRSFSAPPPRPRARPLLHECASAAAVPAPPLVPARLSGCCLARTSAASARPRLRCVRAHITPPLLSHFESAPSAAPSCARPPSLPPLHLCSPPIPRVPLPLSAPPPPSPARLHSSPLHLRPAIYWHRGPGKEL
jgi:hypothetical protein